MYTLRIKPLRDDVAELYKNHTHYHQGDSGLDLFYPDDVMIPAGTLGRQIKMRIACEMFYGMNEAVSFNIYPRSSISKTPLRLSNSIGLVDAGYRGEIMALFDNHSDRDYLISAGDRLLQIVAPTLQSFYMSIVNELSDSDRGTGGIGSTGK